MNKNIKIAIGVFVALSLGLVVLIKNNAGTNEHKNATVTTSVTTLDAQKLGSEFIQQVHAIEFDAAYAMLHKNLQAKLSRAAFEKLILGDKVEKVSGVNWIKDEVGSGVRTVTGASPSEDMKITIKVTELENNGKAGILLFHFLPVKK